MKKIAIFLLCAMLILSGCGADSINTAEAIEVNTAQDSPTYVEGEDYQGAVGIFGSTYAHRFTEGKGGYYYNIYGTASSLMFYDTNAGVSIPVCNQPNCSHEGSECNAFLGYLSSVEFIQYYDGNLYLFGHDGMDDGQVELYRVSADGSTRGKIGTIFTVKGDSVTYNAAIHRGYAYATLNGAGTDKRTVEVHRLSLSGDGESEVVYTFDESCGGIAFLKAYGNYLYMEFCYYADEDGNGYTGDLYRMNIHTGETELLVTNCKYDFVANEEYLFYNRDSEVIAHDLETHEETVILNNGYSNYMALDGNYLCCDNRSGQFLASAFEEMEITDPRTMTIIDVTDLSVLKTLIVEDDDCKLTAIQDHLIYATVNSQTDDGFFGMALSYFDWTVQEDGTAVSWTYVEEH